MNQRIIYIDLTTGKVEEYTYEYAGGSCYGRGLALSLVRENTELTTDRLAPENVIALVPGFLTGCKSPSTGRMIIATLSDGSEGIELCNVTGNMPDTLGSRGIAGVVIKGAALKPNAVIHIGNKVEIDYLTGATGRSCTKVVRALRAVYGRSSASVGIGPAGEMKLPIATVFSTYRHGYPEFYTPRSGLGEVFGSKNLRAIVADSSECSNECAVDRATFERASDELREIIERDEFRKGNMPSLGAAMLLRYFNSERTVDSEGMIQAILKSNTMKEEGHCTSCTEYCSMKCLNRYSRRMSREKYIDPMHIETQLMVQDRFNIDDYDLTDQILKRTNELGITGPDYIEAAKRYSELAGIKDMRKNLVGWLGDIQHGTLTGRIISQGAERLDRMFHIGSGSDGRKASNVRDISDIIDNNSDGDNSRDRDDSRRITELVYLLENMGFCIFTSFAILGEPGSMRLIAELKSARCGVGCTQEELLKEAAECMAAELDFARARGAAGSALRMPVFTSVLEQYCGTDR